MPSPAIFPLRSTITAPTQGFGAASPTPCRAKSSARRKKCSSAMGSAMVAIKSAAARRREVQKIGIERRFPLERFLLEQGIDKFLRIEGQQVADFLADADKAHWQTQFARNGHDH